MDIADALQQYELPDGVLTHINLKREFSRLFDSKPVGIRGALASLKLPPPGPTPRCVDTAKLVAPVAARILQKRDADTEAQAKLAAG